MKVAFDLDGTLITAVQRQSYLMKAVASAYGISIDCDKYWNFKRNGKTNLEILKDFKIPSNLVDKISRAWLLSIEEPYWLGLDNVFDGVKDVLSNLRSQGVQLYLVTARTKEYALRQQLKRLSLDPYLNEIFCVDPAQTIRSKSKILGEINPKIFIGDSESDFMAANKSNIEFRAVSTGQRNRDFLERAGALQIFDDLHDCCQDLIH